MSLAALRCLIEAYSWVCMAVMTTAEDLNSTILFMVGGMFVRRILKYYSANYKLLIKLMQKKMNGTPDKTYSPFSQIHVMVGLRTKFRNKLITHYY